MGRHLPSDGGTRCKSAAIGNHAGLTGHLCPDRKKSVELRAMAPQRQPAALLALHGSRKVRPDPKDAPSDLVALADKADLTVLKAAQALHRQALADIQVRGLFVDGPGGVRVKNPSVAIVSQQARIVSKITAGLR